MTKWSVSTEMERKVGMTHEKEIFVLFAHPARAKMRRKPFDSEGR